ncbi:MAG: F0F1-type ATP synthase delta subunit [Oceanicoccus sp.]|jgi:F0F1-type ATP synthase delta subunit
MLNDFLTALMHEMVRFLAKHPEFFDGTADIREKALENVRMPSTFKHYLAHRKASDFMDDLRLSASFITAPKSAKIEGNAFFKAIVEFFTGTFAVKIDMLNSDFYGFSDEDQKTVVNELIKSDSQVAQTMRGLLIRRNYQELSEGLVALTRRVVGATYIVVQTPREVSIDLKKEMRSTLVKENPLSFPVFQINKKLIGGMRVFKDGQVNDHSWVSRVLHFTSL